MIKLGSEIKLYGGGTPSKAVDSYWNGAIHWLSVKDLISDNISTTQDKISKAGLENSASRLVPKGSLIISTRMAVGKAAMLEIDTAINQDIKYIKCSNNLNKKYLFYCLKANSNYFNRHSSGATVKGIKIEHILNLKIPLPPLKTQERIAALLDNAAALRDKTAELLKEYDLLAQSIFLEMFGDPVRNPKGWLSKGLSTICSVGSSRRVFVNELVSFGVPFYRGKEIGELSTGKSIRPDLFITPAHYQSLIEATGVPKIGDLLLPSICPDGRIFQVKNNEPFYFKDGRVLWIQADQKTINSYYLKFFLRELFRTNYYNIASGTTFAELKIINLKKIKIQNPPLAPQTLFAEKITLIEKQKALAKQELKESEDLFNCLLQKAFKGELV